MTDDTKAEVAPAENAQEAPAMATFVEDAETGKVEDAPAEAAPETIQMQPEDPKPEVTQEGNEAEAPASAVNTGGAPAVATINAEMQAGAERVAQHKAQEALLAQKRESEVSEEQQVAAATEANKEL